MSKIWKLGLRSIMALGITGILLFAAGCGDDNSAPPTTGTVNTSSTGAVTGTTPVFAPAGVTLTLSPGTILTNSAGAPVVGAITTSVTESTSVSSLPAAAQTNLPLGTSLVEYLNINMTTATTSVKTFTPPMLATVTLPAGVTSVVLYSFDTTTGLWTLEPAVVTITNGIASFSISHLSIWACFLPPISITTTSPLTAGTVGTPYVQGTPLAATNGNGTLTWTWTAATGSTLPAGLTLSAAGVITGTPTTAGTFNVIIKVTDSTTPEKTITKPFAITVNPAVPALSITTTPTTLAPGTVGVTYGPVTLTATGGSGSFTWSNPAGTLATAGLALSTAGVITGTPTTASTVSASITVTDTSTPPKTATTIFTIIVSPAVVVGPLTGFTPATFPDATVGALYSVTMLPVGGTAPFTWSDVTSPLPAFLTLNTATGLISGTPAATDLGPFSFDISVTDSEGTPVTIGPLTFNNNVNFDVPTALLFFNDAIPSLLGTGCVACHGSNAGTITGGRTAAQITSAVTGVGSMAALYGPGGTGLTLTAADITALAAAIP
jgi:hypothetical protein